MDLSLISSKLNGKNVTTVSTYIKIYSLVKKIPCGNVMTYGQIASCVDRCTARMVGYAMARVPIEENVPWHRVVNSKGEVSIRAHGEICMEQQVLLISEGVEFSNSGRIDLERYRWNESK